MRKLIAAVLFIILTSYSSAPASVESKVYICVSSSAKVYHYNRDCSGLGNCTHTIKSVTENEAVNSYGRRACRIRACN